MIHCLVSTYLPASTGRSDPRNIKLTGVSLLFQDMQSCHSRITVRKHPSGGSGVSSRSMNIAFCSSAPKVQTSKLSNHNTHTGPVFHKPSVPINRNIRTRRVSALTTLDLVGAGIGYSMPQTSNKSGSREGWLDGASCRF